MKISDLAHEIEAVIVTAGTADAPEKEAAGVYACDLLSWVMSHAQRGDAWITVHTHVNIVAVALMAELSCIIIPEGIAVEEATIRRAELEGITIMSTALGTYEICRRVRLP